MDNGIPIGLDALKKRIPWIVGVAVLLVMFHATRIAEPPIPRPGAATRAKLNQLRVGIDVYEVDMGQYPPSLDSLWSKGAETNWRGPYVKSSDVFVDEWTNRFRYQAREDGYGIRSAGPDRVFDTADDSTN